MTDEELVSDDDIVARVRAAKPGEDVAVLRRDGCVVLVLPLAHQEIDITGFYRSWVANLRSREWTDQGVRLCPRRASPSSA